MNTRSSELTSRRPIAEARNVCIAMFAATMAVYGDLLAQSDRYFISNKFGDTCRYFAYVREFAFAELAGGNMPLWNPHVFAGTPLLGSLQAALLYPLNIPYFFLPIAWAVNVDICLHVFLMGVFTYAWVRNRGLAPIPSYFAAIVTSFGAVTALRVLAGELTLLAAIAWMPFLLLCVDRMLDTRSPAWCCAGIVGTTLQILSGHPGTVLRTAFVLGIYIAFRFWRSEQKARIIPLLGAMAIMPPLLGAVQLGPALNAAGESVRAGGTDYSWAASFSMPLENMLTLLSPVLFGDHLRFPYWGKEFFWDAIYYFGVVALVLAGYGAARGRETARSDRMLCGGIAFFLVLVSLGEYGPVFRVLYEVVPGFDMFRAPGRFAFPAVLFLSVLAAYGVESLLSGEMRGLGGLTRAAGVLAAILLTVSGASFFMLAFGADAAWRAQIVQPLGEFVLGRYDQISAGGLRLAAGLATKGLAAAGGTALVLWALLRLRGKHAWASYAIVVLGIVEVLLFARLYRGSFTHENLDRPELDAIRVEAAAEGYRILDMGGDTKSARNVAMRHGTQVIWGYDPVMLYRFTEFIRRAENFGMDPWMLTMWQPYGYKPIYGMLRCRYQIHRQPGMEIIYFYAGKKIHKFQEPIPEDERVELVNSAPAPRFFFVQEYESQPEMGLVFDSLEREDFDYMRTVVLESDPRPAPEPGPLEASVTVLDESTDHVTLEATLSRPAILVMTDSYSNGWKVFDASGERELALEILPANLAIRAIPLSAGDHTFRLEYRPAGYVWGLRVSLVSGFVFGFACAVVAGIGIRARYRRSNDQESA